ncbi:MAG TPA: hypothetical protein VKH37_08805 [Ferruginibacter sp.]|nr:hypothetical protein [Ferruginibacter sp.]
MPDQGKYLGNLYTSFGIDGFPTHILINKKGQIIKVVNSFREMAPFLEQEASK